MTAAVTVRGLLLEEYEVDWRDMRWVTGPLTASSRYLPRFKDGESNPWGIELEHLPDGENLETELAEGGLDALVTVRPPHAFLEDPEGSQIVRLFPDAHELEKDLYRRLGAFPIMHLVVVRTALLSAHPWLARSLFRGFSAMRDQYWRRLQSAAAAPVGLPWIDDLVEESSAVFGRDPYAYGVAPNRPSLELCLRYCDEQGLTSRSGLAVDELFAPELLQEEMVE